MPPLLANTLLSMESFYSSVDPDLSRPRRLPPKLVAGIRAEVMPLHHSTPCSYFIPPFHLDDITLIITTIMYGFSGSIVALWLSAFSCIIVGTSNGLIAASETSWAIIRHPPRFFFISLPGWWTMLLTFVEIIQLIKATMRRGNTKWVCHLGVNILEVH